MLKKLFAPGNDSFATSLALLVLRAWLGVTLMLNHGLSKLTGFSTLAPDFPDPFGVGHSASLALLVFAEVCASDLLTLGLPTRFDAPVLMVTMSVACCLAHKVALSGRHRRE